MILKYNVEYYDGYCSEVQKGCGLVAGEDELKCLRTIEKYYGKSINKISFEYFLDESSKNIISDTEFDIILTQR